MELAPRGPESGRCLSVADYVMGTGFPDGATVPPAVMDLRETRSNSQIPTLFPHSIPSEFPRIDVQWKGSGTG